MVFTTLKQYETNTFCVFVSELLACILMVHPRALLASVRSGSSPNHDHFHPHPSPHRHQHCIYHLEFIITILTNL